MIVVDRLKEYDPAFISIELRELYGTRWAKLYSSQSEEALHVFAQRIGIPLDRFQESKIRPEFHCYPITPAEHADALKAGAREMTMSQYARYIRNPQWSGGLILPKWR